MALLEVEDLVTRFYTEDGVVNAVDGVSYAIDSGEKFAIVGESGAGKSVLSLSLMRLIDDPGQIEHGVIRFRSEETVERLKSEFPEGIVDLDSLRAEHEVEPLLERLLADGVEPSRLSPADVAPDATAAELAREVTLSDLVDRGYAARLGVVDDDAFIVRDGAEEYVNVLDAPTAALRRIRGGSIAMVFQDPQTALNPVYTVGEQIAEAIRVHEDVTDEEAREQSIEMLERVGIPDPRDRFSDYPHQFSGGMQQRAVIAVALSCDPDLIIADEPTTALDVTIEAQILELLEELAEEFDTAIQLITHDLGVVAELCDRVMVLYAGEPVEKASVEELYYEPGHPYTVGLMTSIPRIGDERDRLDTIPGTMPDLVEVPPGCSFHPRCPFAEEACSRTEPRLVDVETGEKPDGLSDVHAASCLAYTGELSDELDFDVEIRDTGPDASSEGEVSTDD
jgi:peptide/nickel transport system ATP-binding protein